MGHCGLRPQRHYLPSQTPLKIETRREDMRHASVLLFISLCECPQG